jgi:hypothetical protein
MYSNLKMNGLGGFKNEHYWSSSENNRSNSWVQDFNDGSQRAGPDSRYEGYKDRTHIVRPIRQF